MKIAFLVYDSRSGSTLLSREMSSRFEDVFVTPEISFETLFRLGEHGLSERGWASVLRSMYKGHEFINLNVPCDRALELVFNEGRPLSLAEGVKAIIAEFAKLHNRDGSKWVVVKDGRNVRYCELISKLFRDEFHLIHIYRDPRAVINSKLRTIRPYYPEETMAWAGVVPAAIRWKQYVTYVNNARAIGVDVYELKYEVMTSQMEQEMCRLASFLGVSIGVSGKSYQVPEHERKIHGLVLAEGVKKSRAEAWVNELSKWDRYRIEAVCGREMLTFGYEIAENPRILIKALACLAEMPSVLFKFIKHARLLIKRSRVGGKAQ